MTSAVAIAALALALAALTLALIVMRQSAEALTAIRTHRRTHDNPHPDPADARQPDVEPPDLRELRDHLTALTSWAHAAEAQITALTDRLTPAETTPADPGPPPRHSHPDPAPATTAMPAANRPPARPRGET